MELLVQMSPEERERFDVDASTISTTGKAEFDIRDPRVREQVQEQLNRWVFELQAREPRVSARERLVKALGMLGSDHDGEALNAARCVEKCRRSLNMTWDELIVAATEVEFDLAT